MDHQLLCTWLGLPSANWPPDHYTLLGLRPGESDCARIEQQVHDRLARVRCYQLSHPGPATEVMNRLAQAYMCLTDSQAKRAYDAEHFPQLAAPPSPAAVPITAREPQARIATHTADAPDGSSLDTAVLESSHTQIDWREAPPPVRATAEDPPPPVAAAPGEAPAVRVVTAEQAPPPAPPAPAASGALKSQPVDPVFELARSSREARRGLGTRRGLYERIVTTRRLLRAWNRVGKYLARAKRRLTRRAEEVELTRLLTRINDLLADFPPLLGEPGKPGYRVVVLAHDDQVVRMLNGLDEPQREALALDWAAGQALLLAHRQFLLQELQRLRRQSLLGRMIRRLEAALHDHPVLACLALLLVIGAALAVIVQQPW
jgi:hypothetical protein